MKLSRILYRIFTLALLVACLSTGPIVPASASIPDPASGVTYYVSSSGGSDGYDGLSQGKPFATVSKVNSLDLQPGDQVLFKCGDTWRADPLYVIGSGSAGQPITFGAYPAGCPNLPILSGAQPISSWAAYSGNIYQTDLSAGANAGKFAYGVNQLFRGDARLVLGRWPNLDSPDGGYSVIDGSSGSSITDNELPSGNWDGAVAHIKGMRWYILNRQVASSSGKTLNLGAANDCWGACTGWGYFLNNNLNTLDQDGEWYYDTNSHKVYLFSVSGAPPNGQIEGSVILKDDNRAWGGVTLGDDLMGDGPAYITVGNLVLRRWFRDGIAIPTNFAHYEPHHLVIQNNLIQDVDSTGIHLATWVYDAQDGRPSDWRGGYNLTVNGNTIERANRMGIDLYSRESTFSGNGIHEVGMIANLGASGMGCAFDAGGGSCTEDGDGIRVKISRPGDTGNSNTFSGNWIEKTAYNGIDVFGYNNIFEHNVIVQSCYAKGDCGGVRTFGDNDLGSTPVHDLVFHENIIVDTIGNTDGCRSDFDDLFGFGLYIDNYSRDIAVTGNTIINSTVHGILFQNSTGSVTGNTLYNNGRTYPFGGAQVTLGGSPAAISSHTGNILFSLNPVAPTLSLENMGGLGTSDNNSYFNPYNAHHIQANGAKTLAAWQSFSGKDTHSIGNWFTLDPGDHPNSSIFYNDTAQPQTISLGSKVYEDLNQNQVSGSIALQPYQSKVLVYVGDAANLHLTMALSGEPDTIPGASLTYMLTLGNQGGIAAAGVVLTHLIPAQIIDTTWDASPGCTLTLESGTRFVWDLASLPAGASCIITVQGEYASDLTPGVPLLLAASAATTSPEVDPGDNQAVLLLGTWLKVYLPLVSR
jgi:hypothetical protein